MMLSRFIWRSIPLRFVGLASRNPPVHSFSHSNLSHLYKNSTFLRDSFRNFSSHGKNGGNGGDEGRSWSFPPANGGLGGSDDGKWDVFDSDVAEDEKLTGLGDDDAGSEKTGGGVGIEIDEEVWSSEPSVKTDFFKEIDQGSGSTKDSSGGDEWETADGYKPWTFEEEGKDAGSIFEGVGEGLGGLSVAENEDLEPETSEADQQLQKEKQELSAQLKGPNRAFGDLIAASGITEAMLDSLIALKDLEGIEGLPPLREIEESRLARNESKSTRAEMEKKKQEEIARARVRQVDEKGRAYGTGKRKCSIARVWIQPGDGKFIINDKQFDVHFPILDHRADILKPFVETKTLGRWDVKCTVKGGGVSGHSIFPNMSVTNACGHLVTVLTLPYTSIEHVAMSGTRSSWSRSSRNQQGIAKLGTRSPSVSQASWTFDEGLTYSGKEKAWKSQSKKKFPVGQAMS